METFCLSLSLPCVSPGGERTVPAPLRLQPALTVITCEISHTVRPRAVLSEQVRAPPDFPASPSQRAVSRRRVGPPEPGLYPEEGRWPPATGQPPIPPAGASRLAPPPIPWATAPPAGRPGALPAQPLPPAAGDPGGGRAAPALFLCHWRPCRSW